MAPTKDLNDLLSILENLEIDYDNSENFSDKQPDEKPKKESRWKLEISPDLFTVTLHIKPAEDSTPITSEQLINEIKKQNITYGIDWSACCLVDNIDKETKITVAKGKPCVPSVNADIKTHFSTKYRELIPIGKEEKVDFKNRYKFTCIKPGDLLVEKTPPIYGKPGINVKGQVVPPNPPKDIELIAGSGTKINDEKNQIFSTINGRPLINRIKDKVIVKVVPSLKYEGDVDMSTGNIQFSGDVLISGSVKDGMMVKSQGQIVIGKIVSNANLQASEGIKIYGNAISSYIAADLVFSSALLYKIIVKIQDQLKKIILIMKQVIRAASLKGTNLFGPLYKVLIDKKFEDLPQLVAVFYDIIQKIPQDVRPIGLLRFSKELVYSVKYPLTIKDIKQLEDILKKVCHWGKNFETQKCLSKKISNVILKYAQNTHIRASGDVVVFGDGCYNSSIQSGGSVHISGVFRGGKILAKKNVFVSEAGSEVGTRTDIYVRPESQITLSKVFNNTAVHFGKLTYKFSKSNEKIKIRRYNDRITITHY